MPLFRFRALSEQGASIQGEQVASSLEGLEDALKAQGLLLQDARTRRLPNLRLRRNRVHSEDILHFCQELNSLLRAGLTVPAALEVASDRPNQPRLEKTLQRILEEVRQGSQLSEAFSYHPEIFEPLLLAAVRTGERTGQLAPAISRYQQSLQRRIELRRKLSQAFAYPVFLLFTTGLALAILFVFVLPRFVELYSGFGAKIPWPTRGLIALVENLELILPGLAASVVAGWLVFRYWTTSYRGKRQWDRLKAALPIVGPLITERSSAYFARVLGDLQNAGMPLVAAIETASDADPDSERAHRIKRVAEMVKGGESLAPALREERLLPPTALKMVEAGEASSDLEGLLLEVSEFLEGSLTHRLSRVMALVEPVLMLLMGLLIGGIILVMYLPIFGLATVVQ